jgi:hypothetical protein
MIAVAAALSVGIATMATGTWHSGAVAAEAEGTLAVLEAALSWPVWVRRHIALLRLTATAAAATPSRPTATLGSALETGWCPYWAPLSIALCN